MGKNEEEELEWMKRTKTFHSSGGGFKTGPLEWMLFFIIMDATYCKSWKYNFKIVGLEPKFLS